MSIFNNAEGLICQRKIMEIIVDIGQQGKNTLGSSWFIKSSSYHCMRYFILNSTGCPQMYSKESKLNTGAWPHYQSTLHPIHLWTPCIIYCGYLFYNMICTLSNCTIWAMHTCPRHDTHLDKLIPKEPYSISLNEPSVRTV